MNIKKLFTGMAASSLLLTFAVTGQANGLDDIKSAGVIKVATSLSVQPYTYTDTNMQPTGSDVETAQLLAKDLGVKLEIVGTTVSARIPTLTTGKADVVISVLAQSPEREKVIDFSIPYSVNENVLIGPKDAKIAGYEDLSGETIGVTRGTVEDHITTTNAKESKIRRYEDVPTLVTAVVSGQVQVSAGSLTMLSEMNKASDNAYSKKFTLQESMLGIGLRKNNPELKEWLNNWIRENLKNGKLNAIYKKYHGVDLPPSIMNQI